MRITSKHPKGYVKGAKVLEQDGIKIATIFPRNGSSVAVYCGKQRELALQALGGDSESDHYCVLFATMRDALDALRKTAELRVKATVPPMPEPESAEEAKDAFHQRLKWELVGQG